MNKLVESIFKNIGLISSITEPLKTWAISIIESLEGPGIALLIGLENVFPPLPSELILPLAGFSASRGELDLIATILWATLGSVIGALTLYGLGGWFGRERLRTIIIKMPLMRVSDFDKTENWFKKHEAQTVFWGRMIPIFRSLISIPAGVERMPLPQFILFSAAGSLVWNSSLIIAGYLLGEQWEQVSQYVSIFQYIVIALLLVFIGWFLHHRIKKFRHRRSK